MQRRYARRKQSSALEQREDYRGWGDRSPRLSLPLCKKGISWSSCEKIALIGKELSEQRIDANTSEQYSEGVLLIHREVISLLRPK